MNSPLVEDLVRASTLTIRTADLNNNSSNTIIDTSVGTVGNQLQVDKASFSLYKTPRDDVISTLDDFKSFMGHPVLVDHLQWTSTTPQFTSVTSSLVRLWMTTIASAPLGNKFKNFRYFTGDINVRVVVQGANYAFGQMVYAFTPLTVASEGQSEVRPATNLVNCKVVPHLPLDPAMIKTYEISLPNPHVYSIYPVAEPQYTTTYGGSYEMTRHVINALDSGTAATPNISICTYVYWTNIQMHAVTTVDGLMGDPIKEEKAPRGLLSGPLHTASTFSSLFSSIPIIGEGASLFSTAAGAAANFLSFLGFNKPTIQDSIAVLPNKLINNQLTIDGRSSEFVLASRNKNHYGIVEHPMQDLSHMEMQKIASINGLVNTTYITQSITSGQKILTMSIHPEVSIATGNATTGSVFLTPLAGLCRMFHFWRGDLDYTFEIVASVFHRGTLVFAFDPRANPAPPTLDVALQTLKTLTVNISGNVGGKIRIPYQFIKPLIELTTGTYADGASNAGNGAVMGQMHVYVLNPIIANGSTAGVYMNTYYSSSNCRFFMLNNMNATQPGTYAFRPTATVTPLGFGSSDQQMEFTNYDVVEFGPATDLSNTSGEYFGEEVYTTKQVATRQFLVASSRNSETLTPDTAYTAANSIQSYTNSGQTRNTLSYLLGAYLGFRGSLRWTYLATPDGRWDDRFQGLGFAFHSKKPIYTLNAFGPPTADSYYEHWGACSQNFSVIPALEFTAPPAVNGLYRPTGTYGSTGVDYVNFRVPRPAGTNNPLNSKVLLGGGDDFSFFYFLGFPTISWAP